MSVIASFDILFIKNNVYNFSAKSLLYEMTRGNWNFRKNDKICYLPLNDELFEWKEENILESEFIEIIDKKEQNHETVGVILYWQNTDIGISMLIFQDCQVSFNIGINRLKLDSVNDIDITNMNWYIEKIINCCKKFEIVEVNFNQTW